MSTALSTRFSAFEETFFFTKPKSCIATPTAAPAATTFTAYLSIFDFLILSKIFASLSVPAVNFAASSAVLPAAFSAAFSATVATALSAISDILPVIMLETFSKHILVAVNAITTPIAFVANLPILPIIPLSPVCSDIRLNSSCFCLKASKSGAEPLKFTFLFDVLLPVIKF